MRQRLAALALGLALLAPSIAPAAAAGLPPTTANHLAGVACLLAAAGVPLGGRAIASDVDVDGTAVLTFNGGVAVTIIYLDLDGNHVFTCGEPITSVTIAPPT